MSRFPLLPILTLSRDIVALEQNYKMLTRQAKAGTEWVLAARNLCPAFSIIA